MTLPGTEELAGLPSADAVDGVCQVVPRVGNSDSHPGAVGEVMVAGGKDMGVMVRARPRAQRGAGRGVPALLPWSWQQLGPSAVAGSRAIGSAWRPQCSSFPGWSHC